MLYAAVNHIGRYSTNLPRRNRRLSYKPRWVICTKSVTEPVTNQDWRRATARHNYVDQTDRVRFFRSLTRSDQLWSFPSRFSIVSGTKVLRFLIVPEQPVSIQNRSGSIVRKPGVAGEMSGVSQSDLLFTTDGFQASW